MAFVWLMLGAGMAATVFGETKFVEGVVHFDDRDFFPFGVWDPGGDYRGVAEHGMNCFLAHASPEDMAKNGEIFDQAQAHGLKVNLYLGYDHVKHAEATERIVGTFKDHPAALAWMIGDDMNITALPRVEAMAAQIKEIDRSHPVAGDAAHTADLSMEDWVKFKPYLDVMLQYDYRDESSFSRYVDADAVEGVQVELPLSDGAHLVAVPLGVQPGKAELTAKGGTRQLRLESVELTAAVLILPDDDTTRTIRSTRDRISGAEAELCVRAAEYQLQKVQTVYEQCDLSLPESARPFAGLYYGMPNFFAAMRDR